MFDRALATAVETLGSRAGETEETMLYLLYLLYLLALNNLASEEDRMVLDGVCT